MDKEPENGTQPGIPQGDAAENTNTPTSTEEETPEQRDPKMENLYNLFNHISEHENFENDAFDELIKNVDAWRPFRCSTIEMLNDIHTMLIRTLLKTSVRNVGISAIGATVGLLSLAVPGLNVATFPWLVATCATATGVSVLNMGSGLEVSINKEKEMKELSKEDHTHMCKLYESLDKLVKESQDWMQLDDVAGHVPVDAGAASGVAISRGVAAGLGSIGIDVDLGMMALNIEDLVKGSKHTLAPFLAKKIKQLENDMQIINAVCYYVALHKIQLLLR